MRHHHAANFPSEGRVGSRSARLGRSAPAELLRVAALTMAWLGGMVLLAGCESLDHEVRRHYESAAEEQQYIDKAIAAIRARPDAIKLARQYPNGKWTAVTDISLASSAEPTFCPGEYEVRLQQIPDVDGDNDPVWWVDVRNGGTRRGRSDADVDVMISRANDATDVEHHFSRVEKCLNGKSALLLPPDAL